MKICWFVYLSCLLVFHFFGSEEGMKLGVSTALAITFESGVGSWEGTIQG